MLRECQAIQEERQPAAPITLDTRVALAFALLGGKKHADAEALLVNARAGLAANPDSHHRVAAATDALIVLYVRTGKPDEAKKWRTERAKFPPELAPAPRPAQ